MLYQLKSGVSTQNLQQVMLQMLDDLAKLYKLLGMQLTVTSTDDGKHIKNSLHYDGLAVDIRNRDIPERHRNFQAKVLILFLMARGKEWQLVIEKDHFHIEYDTRINHEKV